MLHGSKFTCFATWGEVCVPMDLGRKKQGKGVMAGNSKLAWPGTLPVLGNPLVFCGFLKLLNIINISTLLLSRPTCVWKFVNSLVRGRTNTLTIIPLSFPGKLAQNMRAEIFMLPRSDPNSEMSWILTWGFHRAAGSLAKAKLMWSLSACQY